MQDCTKFVAASAVVLGACCHAAASRFCSPCRLRGRKNTGGEPPQVLFRLGANEPASPPRNGRKKQFILTNGESLQRGWPFLSKLVYHAAAYMLEQREEGTGSQAIYASLTEGDDQQLRRARLQKIPAYPPGILVAGKHRMC